MRSFFVSFLITASLTLALPLHAGSSMAKLNGVGDDQTLLVTMNGQQLKIRMHGVAIPPPDPARPILQRLNKESVAFLKKYLGDGWVYLEYPSGTATPDERGEIPAFVYRGSDATLINAKLVSAGLAIVNTKQKNTFTAEWMKLQNNAQATEAGIWGSFEEGDGERIAAGVSQSTYVGIAGASERRVPTYVIYWIRLY